MASPHVTPRRSLGLLRTGALLVVVACGFFNLRTCLITAATSATGVVDADDAGQIQEWILFLPDFNGQAFWDTQARLVVAADAAIRFRLVYSSAFVRDSFEALLAGHGFTGHERLRWDQAEQDVPPWTRDYFVLGRGVGGESVYLLHNPAHYDLIPAPPTMSRGGLLREVRRQAGSGARQAEARLDGGSIVANRRHAFINGRAIDLALRAGDLPNRPSVVAHLEKTYGRPVIPMTELQQLHCDLYLMPAGEGRLVVGHPRRALELIDATPDALKTFVAEVRAFGAKAPADHPMRMLASFDGAQLLAMNRQPKLLAAFDAVIKRLEALGYTCIQVPFLSAHATEGNTLLALSYTNVIQDERAGARTVYLPTYRLPVIDDAAKRAWQGIGYEVRSIDSLEPGIHGGALRCLSQVLRTPPLPH